MQLVQNTFVSHIAQHDGLPPFIEVCLHSDASYLIADK